MSDYVNGHTDEPPPYLGAGSPLIVGSGQAAQVAPTQTVYPWRAVTRTAAAFLVALLPLLPELAVGLHVDGAVWVGQTLAVAGAVTRVLAMPDVERFVKTWAPWLSAQPPLSHQDGSAGL